MSSLNITIATLDAINNSACGFYQFWSYLMISLGIIGHSLSIYAFTRPTLRSNPCVRYFLAVTLCGLFVTLINTPLRLLQFMYNRDAFGYSMASCKILTFVVTWTRYFYKKVTEYVFVLAQSRALTSWFISLASIDR